MTDSPHSYSTFLAGVNVTETMNISTTPSPSGCPGSVHDIETDLSFRLLILYLTIGFSVVGTILVLLWMICNRRLSPSFNHLSRVNAFILNLTCADILVILLAVLPQVIWEIIERDWYAGDFMCRFFKFLQTCAMTSSNYMLVVIAIDRHQAIRSPLKEPISVLKLAGGGWIVSALLSLPVTGIFHVSTDANGKTMCINTLRYKPMWHRQLWVTWVFAVVFLVPLITMVVCYTRIFMEISRKALHNSVKYRPKKGQVCLQSTHSNSLPKAKIKTLKMTFVIILTFIICSTPYFIVEMIMSYGDHCIISKKLYGILGGMAACNSATNPYVFLAFNIKDNCVKQWRHCSNGNGSPVRGYTSYHSGGNTAHTGHSIHSNGHHSNGIHKSFSRQETVESRMELKPLKGDTGF